MRIINPMLAAANQSTDPLKSRSKHRWWIKDKAHAKEYLKANHKFEMLHNQERTGEFRVMTGLEAKALNDNHRQDYRDEINRVYPAHVSVPMKRWALVERFTLEMPEDKNKDQPTE
jgi:hypothetical protein